MFLAISFPIQYIVPGQHSGCYHWYWYDTKNLNISISVSTQPHTWTLLPHNFLRMKTESSSAGLTRPLWLPDLQAGARSIPPPRSLPPLIHSDSSSSAPQPGGLRHRHLLKGSDVLGLLQEVQDSVVSAPFRGVNTTCHHSSGRQEENTDTSRPHYFVVLKHLDIRSLQCSTGGGRQPRPGVSRAPQSLINISCGALAEFSLGCQTLGDGVGRAGADVRHVSAVSELSPAFTSVEKWQRCHSVTTQVVHTAPRLRAEARQSEKFLPPRHPNTHSHSTQKKVKRGKSLGEKPPMSRTGWWDVGLIKSCCHCGVLVTRSHAITEISVWEESAPTTHFLPIEGGGAKWDRLLYKIPRKRESFFIERNLRIVKGRERAQGGRRRMRRNAFVFW